jgi:hypothetical protein
MQVLTTIFLVSGYGVKVYHNGLILLHAAFLCGVGLKIKCANQNQENLLNYKNKPEIICCCSALLLKGKCSNMSLPGCRSVHKILGPMLKSYIDGSAQALK